VVISTKHPYFPSSKGAPMRLDFGARFASYVTLAMSCICLLHAESLFLPGIGWFIPVVLLVLVAAYRLEGSWALPVWVANSLAFLACGTMIVMLRIYVVNNPDSFAANVPFPVALVPYAGPPFLVLLLIKLFRLRRPVDVWHFQAMGVLQAALACVLGGDPFLGLLLLGYVLSGLWWLALHCLQRLQSRDEVPLSPTLIPWRGAGIPRAARWLFVTVACGLVLALLTPRISPSPWNPLELLGSSQAGGRAETGVPISIDLNREGTVEVNDEIVLEIEVKDAAGQPKLDLPVTQRFRGTYLDHYENGRWGMSRPSPGPVIDVRREMSKFEEDEDLPPGVRSLRVGNLRGGAFPPGANAGPMPAAPNTRAPRSSGQRLPNLGPSQYFLKFKLKPRKAGGFFLADPVLLLPEHAFLPVMPVDTDPYTGPSPLFSEGQGALIHISPPRGEIEYRQVTRPVDDSDIGPPVEISPYYELNQVEQPSDSLRQWTNDLARRLAAIPGSGLDKKDLNTGPRGERIITPPYSREKVARALCNHLRDSGEYTYSLDLRRKDHEIDPTEDFLRNVKQGHCQRYAAGLTLMLRSLGIPARIVRGFRGCESRGDGTYIVRNSSAHAWVEALIERNDSDGRKHQFWLALDPTPFAEAPPAPSFSLAKWWENCTNFTSEFWRLFVSEYGTEEQSALASELWSKVSSSGPSPSVTRVFPVWVRILLLTVVVVLGAYLLVRRWRRRTARFSEATPTVAFYARLLDLLAQHARLSPVPGQTPREFGVAASKVLCSSEATAALSDLPGLVATLFYRVRFGAKPLAEEERSAIDQRLDDLAVALANPRRVAITGAGG
jgi:transglutaminase-like putative cysteine protease